ncbi:hypothetical protein CO154_00890 [Candidatus Pacearchaeota archaeon CG_4_9_14_3_um_filter_31_7]|nr:MAG: hypothetical protein AUJ10_02795 [Candidatus Pacearchaeota archaeon CG1_02_31_27]PIN92099.1 MAG: hypothetical protein COU55_02845 [Candidatus Pacearchaeota archaeon CG10_big_fil_rev_8_21_14_0_10_31_59]PIZ80314.1 MAG: hypothetical protein COX99_02950 [Candidatus Pacearchaeota archaeon CG_4_10_14_0_2_um_filter_31_10]PJA70830.1 MAG: hypothetical protein CO154_00890 [Candidatus Pacearchaeota archaeon CG_4_9_14_3_um_filter_31_7]
MKWKTWLNIIISGIILFSPSCKKEVEINKNNSRVSIQTYEKSGQAVHPSIIYQTGEYFLAITPYPNGNTRFENPQLLSSKNGLEFIIIGDSTKPIDFPDKYAHNCDPCLIKNGGTFHLYYVEVELDTCRLMYRNSKDGVSWSPERESY